jgi:hypothetical protein
MSDDGPPDLRFVETPPSGDGGQDVIAGRVRRWNGRRVWLTGLAAAVVVAGVVGYAVNRHGATRAAHPAPTRNGATPHGATRAAHPAPTIAFTGVPPALAVSAPGNQCSAQRGTTLSLGIEIRNGAAQPATLTNLRADFPMGGFRQLSSAVGECGRGETALGGYRLPPGGLTWITVTLRVLERCPTPLPVRFQLGYAVAGQGTAADVGGFNDLAGVPYSGCSS